MPAKHAVFALAFAWILSEAAIWAADPPSTGFIADVRVVAATRLDWQFACAAFGADQANLPRDYDSTTQHYQLYVPAKYTKEKAWPMIVFISPGDDPAGWKNWQKVCEDNGYFFCAAYGAGNNCPAGRRTRITLDAFDDVRRHYHIDPDQTYLSGFSGGGRMACTIGWALPEYFGGIVPICGTNPISDHSYLYHRIRDRLSVAFITGENDFNRRENEIFMFPWFQELKVRSKLWVVPKMGHGIPDNKTLGEVVTWLADDLKRRQQDAADNPLLNVKHDEAPASKEIAKRLLEAGQVELKNPDHTWRGVVLLQGAKIRGNESESAKKAVKLLADMQRDEKTPKLVADQGGAEDLLWISAQAKALQGFGDTVNALKAWQQLVQDHPDTKEAKQAADEIERLKQELANRAFFGVALGSEAAIVEDVVPDSPAAAAGILKGDTLLTWNKTKLTNANDVRTVVAKQKPGDKIVIELERDGKKKTVTVQLATLSQPK